MTANSPERVQVCAPAKLNLTLHVGEKRSDGYHDLQSLIVFANIGDLLSIEDAPGISLTLQGLFAKALAAEEDNLVLKAARALAARDGIALRGRLTLTKRLPVASGIGGGSADAAAALRGLALLWGTGNAEPEWAACIGSDVPACLVSRPLWMEGRGERLTEIGKVPPLHVVLVNPGKAVATHEVFRRLVRRSGVAPVPRAFGAGRDLLDYMATTHNDLEPVAIELVPEIAVALSALRSRGAAFVRMSGSGATCYGIFEDGARAAAAAKDLAMVWPEWWVVPTCLAPHDAGAAMIVA
ncbi:MAG TPA: 4-(cytidine 5'-diphospho)-2-C-methyl-D-erythritol kinase [Rhizomicrobium sp.]|jgi:4-diphosphocytidyl-2-C-methyl-D-erythritol kinase